MQSAIIKKQLAEMLWLLHFNRVLLKQGIITIEEFRRMENLIRSRKSPSLTEGSESPVQTLPAGFR